MLAADFGQDGHRLPDLILGRRLVAGPVQHVGQVAAQGGLVMAIAVAPAERYGFFQAGDGVVCLASGAQGEGQVVAGSDLNLQAMAAIGPAPAFFQKRDGRLQFPPAAGQHTQRIIRQRQQGLVAAGRGQGSRLLGQALRRGRLLLAVGGQALVQRQVHQEVGGGALPNVLPGLAQRVVGQRPFALAQIDLGQLALHRSQFSRGGQGGRRFIAGQGVGIGAQPHRQLAAGRVQAPGLFGAQGQGGAEVVDGVLMGKESACLVAGLDKIGGRLRLQPGLPVMVGDLRRHGRRGIALAGQQLGQAAMQQAAAGQARLLVDQGAQFVVAEIVGGLLRGRMLHQQATRRQHLQARNRLLLAATAARLHQRHIEAVAYGRRRLQYLALRLAHLGQPVVEQIAHRGRYRQRGRRFRRARRWRQGVQVFDHKHR